MATQAERRAATRAAILAAATELFAERGYDVTSITDVIDAAGVSRGALYHHFDSKEDVFAAVFVATSTAAIRRAAAGVEAEAQPIDSLIASCLRWLEIVAEPGVSQILLVDGPSSLGFAKAAELESATSLGVMRRAVAACVEAGEMIVPSIDLSARLINAVVAAAAVSVHDGVASNSEAAAGVAAMIRGLAARPL